MYVIVGGGVASVAAIEGIRRLDRKNKVVLISAESEAPYCRPLISYVLAGKLTEDSLPYRDKDFFQEMGVELVLGEKVVEWEEGRVKTDAGRWFEYERLLVATGSTPKALDAKGLDKEGVFYFRGIRDLKAAMARLPKVKEAVVVGAGMVGMKLVDALLSRRKKVHLVVSSRRVMSMVLGERASKRVERVLREKGVEIYFGEDIVEVEGGGDVERVVLKSGGAIECQAVFIAKGVVPNLEPFSKLKGERGIKTDSFLRASEGIYAAGDVAETFDPLYGSARLNALWFNAYQGGLYAGMNMAGGSFEFPGGIASNSIQVGKLPVATMGMSNVEEGCEVLIYEDDKVFRQFNIREGKLVGAVFMGDVSLSGVVKGLIMKGVDVSGVKEDMLSLDKGFLELVRDTYKEQFVFTVDWRRAVLPERVMKEEYYTPGDYGRL